MLWNLETGTRLRVVEANHPHVIGLSANGKRGVYAHSPKLRVLDLDTGRCLDELNYPGADAVELNADGSRVVAIFGGRTRCFWEVGSGQRPRAVHLYPVGYEPTPMWLGEGLPPPLPPPPKPMDTRDASGDEWDDETVAFSLDSLAGPPALDVLPWMNSNRAIGVHSDTPSDPIALRVWELDSGRMLREIEGDEFAVEKVGLSADGSRAIGASFQTLRLWDLDSGECLQTLSTPHWISAVTLSADAALALSGETDGTIRLWDVRNGIHQQLADQNQETVTVVRLSADGRRAIARSQVGTLRVWDVDTGACLSVLGETNEAVTDVSLSANGKRALSASLRLWDVDTGKPLLSVGGHSDDVCAVSLSQDGMIGVSGSVDKTLRVWNFKTRRCQHIIPGYCGRPGNISVSADGKRAVSGCEDGRHRLWDLSSGQCLRVLDEAERGIDALRISADGRRVNALLQGEAYIWDLDSGRRVRVRKEPDHNISDAPARDGHDIEQLYARGDAVRLSDDGKRAVTAREDVLHLWDLGTGVCLVSAPIGATIRSVDCTPDGRVICGTSRGLRCGRFLNHRPAPPAESPSTGIYARLRRRLGWMLP